MCQTNEQLRFHVFFRAGSWNVVDRSSIFPTILYSTIAQATAAVEALSCVITTIRK